MAKIWVEAYGCSASFADSEMISGLILNGGHILAKNSSESDLNLIVTCSVKDATANKMINKIKKMKTKPLVIAGCLPKAEQSTAERFGPHASLLGPNSIGKTLDVINSTLKGIKKIELEDSDESKVGLPKVRLNSAIGIIEIANGCLSECSFCQTKLSKGDLQSYRIGDIVRQVKHDIEDGCSEIWLSSTDNGCYGFDIETSLPELIENVSSIERDFMVRVGMMNPMYVPRIRDDLLKAYENDKIFKFIHIPVQSGSNQVLKGMKRGHTANVFMDTCSDFRKKFNMCTISTDVIVGFPYETEEDFAQTISLLQKTRPDIINISRYSARPGTKAAKMIQNDVSDIKRRSKIVFELSNKIAFERNLEWVGWKGMVLFDEISDGVTKGRNFAYKPIVIDKDVKIGQKIRVEIKKATKHGLYGIAVS